MRRCWRRSRHGRESASTCSTATTRAASARSLASTSRLASAPTRILGCGCARPRDTGTSIATIRAERVARPATAAAAPRAPAARTARVALGVVVAEQREVLERAVDGRLRLLYPLLGF